MRVFSWNPKEGIIDPEMLRGIDYIIHLSGAKIGEKRWTIKERKKLLGAVQPQPDF